MPARRKSTIQGSDTNNHQVDSDNHDSAVGERDKHESSPPPNILQVVIGNDILEPVYGSFYPEELLSQDSKNGSSQEAVNEVKVPCLYVCHNCFKYTPDASKYFAHRAQCDAQWELPGKLIYRHSRLAGGAASPKPSRGRGRGRPGRPSTRGGSRQPTDGRQSNVDNTYTLHEIDGEDATLFCQNLSLFAKLFLDQKGVCFFPQPFLYYVLMGPPRSGTGEREILGFFSKEKLSWDSNILACILVFPQHQRLGLGRLLMALSYELARKQGRRGGPEGPLSTAGAAAYHRYWDQVVTRALLDEIDAARPGKRGGRTAVNIGTDVKSLSEATHVLPICVANTLSNMGLPARKMRRRKRDGDVEGGSFSHSLNDLEFLDSVVDGNMTNDEDMESDQYEDVIVLDRKHIRDRARKIGLLEDIEPTNASPRRMPQLWEVDPKGWV